MTTNSLIHSTSHSLLNQIKQCRLCHQQLTLPPKPVIQFNPRSKILIAGQAPGIKTHEKGIPFDDASGERLRAWLNVDKACFYDPDNFALVPMGFCYPGKGKSGDLPPQPQCAQSWREQVMAQLTDVKLTIILGQYAIKWHLSSNEPVTTLTQQWQTLLKKRQLVLPHPSPRNNLWQKRNPWFEQKVLPSLKNEIATILSK